ncbi:hypothetical protein BDV95DRAFT_347966 [Massariosphaeria phaeospora]|uniref:Extracellular membrane protein CFEM domain-containing protein n=1 Tax=Massariosphaeria phaeospora TaxID=100035 RepID=A0A7C8ICE1_9PLEO|nr:hypothetical protein BDV95DRAFT_347966 [Massariosphaeria phaeospora]
MLLSHTKRLCTILPSLIAATPQNTELVSSTQTILPVTLERAVPACAQPCLRTSLLRRFPTACTDQANLSCLCSRYSIDGESLGEVALGCIYAACPTVDSTAPSAYGVCLGERGAVSPTKTALTVVVTSSTRSIIMASSSVRIVTTSTSLSTLASTLPPSITSTSRPSSQPLPIPSDTVVADSVSITPSATSISTTPAVNATGIDNPGPKPMSPAQIAGLSVAAAATFIIAIGLMALSVFLRRRREQNEEVDILEKRTQSSSPGSYSPRFSQFFPQNSTQQTPPKQFPLLATTPYESRVISEARSRKKPYSNTLLKEVNPGSAIDMMHLNDNRQSQDPSLTHPLLRGAANNPSTSSVPLDQIGLALSAEASGNAAVPTQASQAHRKSATRQSKSSFRRTMDLSQRPTSVLTQNTVFEEDTMPERRRSSKLLPTPPIPIPPIRSFQPSRSPPAAQPRPQLKWANARQQVPQQPELFLDIPVRHSRTLPKVFMPAGTAELPQLGRLARTLAPNVKSNTTSNATSASELSNTEDIPDYYFTAHQDPSPLYVTPKASPSRVVRSRELPRVINVRSKASSSNLSRTTSRASTTARDSISSQTSFETVDANDPTPDDDDDEKQLSDDNKLSPVAESPISFLRYPKVPRASNQLVPRSPRSPQSRDSQGSPARLLKPSALLVKRRGETETLQLEDQFHMGHSAKPDLRNHMRDNRRHLRSTSVEAWAPDQSGGRAGRVQSGQFPKSPAMYDAAVLRPLTIRSKHQLEPPIEMGALKSPAWVPRLTPTRQGDDLLISVTYSKPGH